MEICHTMSFGLFFFNRLSRGSVLSAQMSRNIGIKGIARHKKGLWL